MCLAKGQAYAQRLQDFAVISESRDSFDARLSPEEGRWDNKESSEHPIETCHERHPGHQMRCPDDPTAERPHQREVHGKLDDAMSQ